MKIIAALILSIAWLGLLATQLNLPAASSILGDLVFNAVGIVLIPITLLISSAIFASYGILALPRFNILNWLMFLFGAIPFIYFYAPLIFATFR